LILLMVDFISSLLLNNRKMGLTKL